MRPLSISGTWLVTPHVYADDRGCFLEWFRADVVARDLGYQPDIAQANCSVSRRGVIRGIHYADVPPGQAKYVTCVSGAILDVVVDLRVGSPTFGRWQAVQLDHADRHALYLAEGLGHAFMALSDQATVLYLCSTAYNPAREHGIHPLDPVIGITWPGDVEVILSEKDAAAPGLNVALYRGLLPRYEACAAHAAWLAGHQPPEPTSTGNAQRSVSRQDPGIVGPQQREHLTDRAD